MKPFNLERAKAGDPVITRDGRKARFLYHANINRQTSEHLIFLIICDENHEWSSMFDIDGHIYRESEDSDLDLHMATITKTRWGIIDQGCLMFVCTFETKADAEIKVASYAPDNFKVAKIEWEE